jgi:hypothetical protein
MSADDAPTWKGIARQSIRDWLAEILADGGPAEDEHGAADAIIDTLGLRCVGWHHWTGDGETSTPLFVLDGWPT